MRVTASDGYIRESILEPTAKVVSGFNRTGMGMPSFAGVLTEEQIQSVILYIKSLHSAARFQPSRSATRGSMRVARRAGIRQAATATSVRMTLIPTKVTGSLGVIPTSVR